jgi:hypothetical protein
MTTESYNEYVAIYWAAACLAFWAGCGVSDGQMSDAVNMVCDGSGLTVPQEVLLKKLVNEMTGE